MAGSSSAVISSGAMITGRPGPPRAATGTSSAGNSDELIRNVYKVLLTRGLRGCMIYSVDQETRQMLAGLGIPSLSAPASG